MMHHAMVEDVLHIRCGTYICTSWKLTTTLSAFMKGGMQLPKFTNVLKGPTHKLQFMAHCQLWNGYVLQSKDPWPSSKVR